jgi:hypothetical protein
MKQLKVSLPDDLRAQLDLAAMAAGNSVAEEIRRRLERSFAQDAVEEKTRELIDDVAALGDWLKRDKALPWYFNRASHETFAEAVQAYFEETRPPVKRDPPGASDLMWSDDPKTLGRAIARHYLRFKTELRKSEQELREIHKRGKP